MYTMKCQKIYLHLDLVIDLVKFFSDIISVELTVAKAKILQSIADFYNLQNENTWRIQAYFVLC